jgi:hypothetical protein
LMMETHHFAFSFITLFYFIHHRSAIPLTLQVQRALAHWYVLLATDAEH